MAAANQSAGADQPMRAVLDAARTDFTAAMPEPLSVRRDRLTRAIRLLLDNRQALSDAMSADFGHRSRHQSLMTDIAGSIGALKHARAHLDKWARPERRSPRFPLGLLGGRAEVRFVPKGVVGIVAPWNFPVSMVFQPLAGVFAAGNRAMIKPSEFTERTSELMAELAAKHFDPTELAFAIGGPEVGKAFSELPFDHMIFTGATGIGRHIMRAAAENLVPVTLELGGKSPTILGRSADVARATQRIATGKMMNAGQICLAPDYLLVPKDREEAVIEGVGKAVAEQYPSLLANDDYSSIVNGRNRDRLMSYLDDARDKGAELIEVNPAKEDFGASNGNKLPLTILRGVSDDMKVMQEEIFGPILPVMTYDRIEQAVDYVNAHDRPLGLYYFGEDRDEAEMILSRTVSGGVTVNDVLFHNAMEDLPFGGIGPSGMGHYHGVDGFRAVSHARAVYRQPKLDVAKLAGFKPPYGKATESSLRRELKD